MHFKADWILEALFVLSAMAVGAYGAVVLIILTF